MGRMTWWMFGNMHVWQLLDSSRFNSSSFSTTNSQLRSAYWWPNPWTIRLTVSRSSLSVSFPIHFAESGWIQTGRHYKGPKISQKLHLHILKNRNISDWYSGSQLQLLTQSPPGCFQSFTLVLMSTISASDARPGYASLILCYTADRLLLYMLTYVAWQLHPHDKQRISRTSIEDKTCLYAVSRYQGSLFFLTFTFFRQITLMSLLFQFLLQHCWAISKSHFESCIKSALSIPRTWPWCCLDPLYWRENGLRQMS